MFGMTVEKITVSIPRETLAKARGAIRRGRAPSISAYVTQALEERAKDDELIEMLDEILKKTGGPMTRAERHEADQVLGVRPSRWRQKK
jgi:Arc/MetJ-type ribon-helix-helix transcriptional regulator